MDWSRGAAENPALRAPRSTACMRCGTGGLDSECDPLKSPRFLWQGPSLGTLDRRVFSGSDPGNLSQAWPALSTILNLRRSRRPIRQNSERSRVDSMTELREAWVESGGRLFGDLEPARSQARRTEPPSLPCAAQGIHHSARWYEAS